MTALSISDAYFEIFWLKLYKDAEIFFHISHLYNAKRSLKMYNKSKLIVTVKCLIGAKGVQTSLMLQLLISVSGHLILSAF